MYFEAANKRRRRNIADQARAVTLAIAGAFGDEGISEKLDELEG